MPDLLLPDGRVTRRTVLSVSAGAALVAGCTGDPASPGSPGSRAPRAEDPDLALAARALEDELTVLRAAEAAAALPALAALAAPVAESHRRHVDLLRRAVPGSPGTTPLEEPSPGTDRPRAVLQALAAAEERLSASQRRRALRARSGDFARVLASLSASAAQQAAALEGARPSRRARR